MESQLNDFLVKLENKQQLATVLAQLESWLVKLGGGAPEKSIRKASSHGQLEEFCRLQDSFAYNLCGRLVRLLEGNDDSVVLKALHVIQGTCLLHRPSRIVFDSDVHLKNLLHVCQNATPEAQIAAINTLCAVMVRQTTVIRRFEQMAGLKTVTVIFKDKNTTFKVKRAILEFLFFYLIPETRYPKDTSRKTTADKQVMLGRYLSNVDGLVRELEVNKPFGNMDVEW